MTTEEDINIVRNSANQEQQEVSLTDILQAHDILLSILLGKALSKYSDPAQFIDQILKMTDIQEINHNAKQHIRLLLQPLKETLKQG